LFAKPCKVSNLDKALNQSNCHSLCHSERISTTKINYKVLEIKLRRFLSIRNNKASAAIIPLQSRVSKIQGIFDGGFTLYTLYTRTFSIPCPHFLLPFFN